MYKSRVLVTGAAGYVGSVLVRHLLEAKYKVVALDSLMYDNGSSLLTHLPHDNFEFHREDVRNWLPVQNLAQKCDVVIPLAALVGAPICERRPDEARAVNFEAVRNLVKSLSPNQIVVYPNTNSGYGSTDGSVPCTEDQRLYPISAYGLTKCGGEDAVLDHPRSASLRLATVFGASPRMRLDLMVNDFTQKLLRDRRIELYEPHFMRNFVGVQDVARAFVHVLERMEKGFDGGAFNLGHPNYNLTKLALARTVARELGVVDENVTVGTGTDPDQRNYFVSNDKILRTGFTFKHRLNAGILEVARVVTTHTPEQLKGMRNVR